ncbi:hypothetical protein FHS02_004387 [Massilia umbonata]|uniref:Uncharacterized protein n=1 Tax=Pseudoduganella umbonata TaxID=864828 RepID=A0A7W5HDU5_9BURK|nr:hypothetical protein [Pseudoduganella umbonata]
MDRKRNGNVKPEGTAVSRSDKIKLLRKKFDAKVYQFAHIPYIPFISYGKYQMTEDHYPRFTVNKIFTFYLPYAYIDLDLWLPSEFTRTTFYLTAMNPK